MFGSCPGGVLAGSGRGPGRPGPGRGARGGCCWQSGLVPRKCGGTERCRRWHVHRVTKRPRIFAHQAGSFARCLVQLARNRRVDVAWVLSFRARSVGPSAVSGLPLGCPWSRGPLTPLYSSSRGEGNPLLHFFTFGLKLGQKVRAGHCSDRPCSRTRRDRPWLPRRRPLPRRPVRAAVASAGRAAAASAAPAG